MLKVTDLTFSYGERPLYKEVSFVVGKGQKVGIVGPNGSGKSTLLSIIRGEEDGYRGQVKTQGKIALVPQEIKYDPDMEKAKTVRDYVDNQNLFQDHEIKKMFIGLELSLDLNHDPKTLSGGEKTKLALARALFQNPEILLLDEPTNFMDKEGKAWVMKFISEYEGTVLLISHDLKLMDRAIDKVLVISPHSSSIEEYKGTYSDYIRLKKEHDERLRKEIEIKSRHLKKAQSRYQGMRADEKKSVLRRRIEREILALPQVPAVLRKIKVKLPTPRRVGELPIRVVGISKNYGDSEILRDVNFSVLRNERIAFIGSNGTGKSTLIKIMMGRLIQDSGEVIKDPGLSVGYYSQEFETFDFEKAVIDIFCSITNKDQDYARVFLGSFLFSNEKVFQNVGSLSGGEKTRLSIATLAGADNNLLVLDEPTTYLDVLSQRIILESLKKYEGAMIIVSHTPEFVRELSPHRALLFPEQKMVYWDDQLLDGIAEI